MSSHQLNSTLLTYISTMQPHEASPHRLLHELDLPHEDCEKKEKDHVGMLNLCILILHSGS